MPVLCGSEIAGWILPRVLVLLRLGIVGPELPVAARHFLLSVSTLSWSGQNVVSPHRASGLPPNMAV